MTDESNGESSFEFVDKKLEDFSSLIGADVLKTDITKASTVAVTVPETAAGNILSNVAPPSALPKFITSTPPESSFNPSSKLSRDQVKNQNIQPLTELSINNLKTQGSISTSADDVPQILNAPESTPFETGALAESLFTWVKDTVANSNVLSKVAEKAKNSVNSMITTLDPQMREFIYSGGEIEILVASNEDTKVASVREAFQNVFGNATVNGINIEAKFGAIQPIGFTAGMEVAHQKIAALRKKQSILQDIPIVAVENFLLEVGENKWYDLGTIVLEDVKHNINLQTFTQMTPVPSQIVKIAKESTPENYSKNGYVVTIASLMGNNLQVPCTEWHKALTGASQKDIIFLAALSLAGIYKNTINPV